MHVSIENLAKLQSVELERSRLTQMARTLPAEIAKAEGALTEAQRKAAEASDALVREDSLRTRLERETEGHRQKAARYRAQLDSVTTTAQAAAIEHEVGFAEREIERAPAHQQTRADCSDQRTAEHRDILRHQLLQCAGSIFVVAGFCAQRDLSHVRHIEQSHARPYRHMLSDQS